MHLVQLRLALLESVTRSNCIGAWAAGLIQALAWDGMQANGAAGGRETCLCDVTKANSQKSYHITMIYRAREILPNRGKGVAGGCKER